MNETLACVFDFGGHSHFQYALSRAVFPFTAFFHQSRGDFVFTGFAGGGGRFTCFDSHVGLKFIAKGLCFVNFLQTRVVFPSKVQTYYSERFPPDVLSAVSIKAEYRDF